MSLPFLLDVKQCDSLSISQQETAGPCIVDVLTVRGLDFLGDLVLQVLDDNLRHSTYHAVIPVKIGSSPNILLQ